MAIRKTKSKSDTGLRVNIEDACFVVLHDRSKAVCRMNIDVIKGENTVFNDEITAACSTLYIDDENNVIQAGIQAGNRKHVNVFRYIATAGEVSASTKVTYKRMQASCIGNTLSLYHTGHYRYDGGSSVVYRSKHEAIRAMIDRLSMSLVIGGLSLVSFANVSDDFLGSFGYIKIRDILGNGPDMWCGNVNGVLSTTWGEEGRNARDKLFSALQAEISRDVAMNPKQGETVSAV